MRRLRRHHLPGRSSAAHAAAAARCASCCCRARGTLVAWTTQGFPPGAPYAGPTGKDFVPFGVGLVQLGDVIRVEGRLDRERPGQAASSARRSSSPWCRSPPTPTATRSSRSPSSRSNERSLSMTNDVAIIGVGLHPVRPVREDRDGDGRRGHPIRPDRRRRGVEGHPVRLRRQPRGVQPRRGDPPGRADRHHLHQRVQRLRHRGQRHPADRRHHPAGQVRHRHRHRPGQAPARRVHRRPGQAGAAAVVCARTGSSSPPSSSA